MNKTNKEIIEEFNSNIMLKITSSEASADLTTITFGKREFYDYSNELIEQALKAVEEREREMQTEMVIICLQKVLKSKTDPKLIACIVEDLREELV